MNDIRNYQTYQVKCTNNRLDGTGICISDALWRNKLGSSLSWIGIFNGNFYSQTCKDTKNCPFQYLTHNLHRRNFMHYYRTRKNYIFLALAFQVKKEKRKSLKMFKISLIFLLWNLVTFLLKLPISNSARFFQIRVLQNIQKYQHFGCNNDLMFRPLFEM